jgi:ABC-type maltose transport system permease subunit
MRCVGLENHPVLGLYESGPAHHDGDVRRVPGEVQGRLPGGVAGADYEDVRLFFQVILPLLRPVIVTVTVVQAVTVFNDFQNPLYFLPGNDLATVQLTLYNFQSQSLSQYNLLFTDILLITIPPLVLYVFFNRQIVAGITSGAIKG